MSLILNKNNTKKEKKNDFEWVWSFNCGARFSQAYESYKRESYVLVKGVYSVL